jgi:hypothetical protein
MRFARTLSVAAAAVLAFTTAIAAQQPPAAAPLLPAIQTKVDVVVSRYLGEKKTSSLPFTLWINIPANSNPDRRAGSASLRMGVDVPVGTKTTTSANTSGSSTTTSGPTTMPQYRNVGTSVDGRVTTGDNGVFGVDVRVEDSSIYTPEAPGRGVPRITDPMAFRTFSMLNNLPMRDGQTLEYATATDKISGEVVKVNVTLTVVK